MANVTIDNVVKRYGAAEIMHGVNVDIDDGEFVVLVGPSGCGKSTLLRMIAGLEGVTAGTIRIGDRVVNNLPPFERDIAMVFQNYALYPHKTVASNMGFALRMARMPKEEIAQRVNRAADILGLKPYLDRYPRSLSGGQRQRVAMGRAIVRNPKVFLFDEPLSNLDAALRVQMRTEIARIHHRLGATMIYVTHDQTEAMTMADRIVVLRAGVIEQVGAPLDLYERPAHVFVAGFLGSPKMNFLKGRVTASQGTEVEIEVAGGVRLPARVRPGSASVGDDVTLGLRPELLTVAPDGPISGHVEVVEQLGSTQLAYATLLDGTTAVAELRDRRPPPVGHDARFAVSPGIRHVFDAQGHAITLPEGGSA